jgi:thiol-disulfide isomerase/thioredoxin/cytochrome c-type biogenesis protein CcmH/NrfG
MGSLHILHGKRLASALVMAVIMTAPSVALADPSGADEKKPAAKPAPRSAAEEESDALDEAFQASPTDPQALIMNLEGFLARFPQSARREQVLRTIYRRALESNDSAKAAEAIERLVTLKPDDPDLLSAAADIYDRQSDAASRQKAIEYSTRFIAVAEAMTEETRPADVSVERWPEVQPIIRATGYAMRGKYYAKAGEHSRAIADFEKSLAEYPTAQIAEQLGDAAMKTGETERAIQAYATAFAMPDKRVEPARRDQVRQKLGSAYVAQHQSEQGLGDLILARYDELVRTLAGRFKSDGKPAAETRNPLEYPLQKLDGSPAKLADFHGKLLVMEFWATWCPPCRVEGKLFERVIETFRDEPRVAFLAVNADEDRSLVPQFIKEEGWTAPVVYAQGLDQLMGIRALPTTMILGPDGRVVFRQMGLDIASFVETLEGAIREALRKTDSVSHGIMGRSDP